MSVTSLAAMAPLTLLISKPYFLKLSLSTTPRQNPNPNFASFSLPSSPLSLSLRSSPSPSPICCSVNNYGDLEQEAVKYPRPEEIEWSKDLSNSVRLIGTVGKPVQIKHLDSGNVVAWTRIGVYKSATDTTWVNLTFWNELAHVASQHLEIGQRIFVSGKLISDVVKGEDEKTQVYYKVVVEQLNFVGSSAPVSSYNPSVAQISPGSSFPSSVEERWQAFFANPLEWWDNRNNKKNPNYPDFKHKDTGEALWINNKYNPPWVNSQLQNLDSKMASMQDNSRNSVVSFSDMTTF